MSKPKKSAAQWLGDTFKNSLKFISESLSTDQYNQFVQDAEALQVTEADDSEGSDDEDSEGGDNTPEAHEGGENPQNTDLGNSGSQDAELQNQVTALTTQLNAANVALSDEKKAHEATAALLTSAQSAVSAAESKYRKLRQAVNPMSDEDLSNKDNNEKQNAGMTKTDIEAREAYKRNNPQA